MKYRKSQSDVTKMAITQSQTLPTSFADCFGSSGSSLNGQLDQFALFLVGTSNQSWIQHSILYRCSVVFDIVEHAICALNDCLVDDVLVGPKIP